MQSASSCCARAVWGGGGEHSLLCQLCYSGLADFHLYSMEVQCSSHMWLVVWLDNQSPLRAVLYFPQLASINPTTSYNKNKQRFNALTHLKQILQMPSAGSSSSTKPLAPSSTAAPRDPVSTCFIAKRISGIAYFWWLKQSGDVSVCIGSARPRLPTRHRNPAVSNGNLQTAHCDVGSVCENSRGDSCRKVENTVWQRSQNLFAYLLLGRYSNSIGHRNRAWSPDSEGFCIAR